MRLRVVYGQPLVPARRWAIRGARLHPLETRQRAGAVATLRMVRLVDLPRATLCIRA